MIRDIFEKILFMGSQAVPVIVIVFALRILLYRFHKKYLYFFMAFSGGTSSGAGIHYFADEYVPFV